MTLIVTIIASMMLKSVIQITIVEPKASMTEFGNIIILDFLYQRSYECNEIRH